MKKKDLLFVISRYVAMTLSIVLGLLFIMQVIRIYNTDNVIKYSREIVGKYLLQILPCIILFVLSVIFIGIYAVIKNISQRDNVKLTNKDKFDNIMRTIDKNDIQNNSLLRRENILRKVMIGVNIFIAISSLLICLYYLFFVKKFDGLKDLTPQIIDCLVHFTPWIGITLLYSLINIYVCDFSYARSIDVLKQIECKKENKIYVASKYEKYITWGLKGFFIVLSISLIIFGAVNKDAQSVLLKATNLCTECVGLG